MPGASCSALQQRSSDLGCRRNRKTWQSSPSIPVINITKTGLKIFLRRYILYFDLVFRDFFLFFNNNSSSVAYDANSNLLACKTQIEVRLLPFVK